MQSLRPECRLRVSGYVDRWEQLSQLRHGGGPDRSYMAYVPVMLYSVFKVQKVFSHFLQQVKLWLAGGSAQVAGPNLGFLRVRRRQYTLSQ